MHSPNDHDLAMLNYLLTPLASCFGVFLLALFLKSIGGMFNLWRVLPERTVHSYTYFGKAIGSVTEPGLYSPVMLFGPRALLLTFFGQRYEVETNIRQSYLRDQLVNSAEGAPMGVGVWYEYKISQPEAYLFRNSDPLGSLRANVASAIVKQLSNLKLEILLEDRDALSRRVREEVSPTSNEWGFTLGSSYIRKVAFKDESMIQQIQKKVVNRLRQQTAAILQAGQNEVALISSDAAKSASEKMGEAQALRPKIVGGALEEIRRNPVVAKALFTILDIEATLRSRGEIVILPSGEVAGQGAGTRFILNL